MFCFFFFFPFINGLTVTSSEFGVLYSRTLIGRYDDITFNFTGVFKICFWGEFKQGVVVLSYLWIIYDQAILKSFLSHFVSILPHWSLKYYNIFCSIFYLFIEFGDWQLFKVGFSNFNLVLFYRSTNMWTLFFPFIVSCLVTMDLEI